MIGLVSYGSDSEGSDNEDEQPQQPQPAQAAKVPTAPPKSALSFLNLPPPKSSLSLPPPATSSSSTSSSAKDEKGSAAALSKKGKGPVKIMLDLPPVGGSSSSSAAGGKGKEVEEEPPRKKPKFSLGSGSGGGLSGLAAMLPAPKNESPAAKLEAALGAAGSGVGVSGAPPAGSISTGFVPHSLLKGKKLAAPAVVAPPAPTEPEVEAAPMVDFFGLGAVTGGSSSTTSTSKAKSITISSAPTVVEKPPPPKPSTYGDAPTPDDPYPGFTQLPSGQWVAKDQATYDKWMEAMAAEQQAAAVPKGFDQAEMNRMGVVDVDASKAREAWEKRPGQVPKPGADKPVPKQQAKVGGRARSKHQLSALLSEAVQNRDELEERIAQGRINRKSAGNKYGF